MTYTGKQFEQDFMGSMKDGYPDIFTLRLYDTTNKFKGIANACDFVMSTPHGAAFLELKVTHEASLPFRNINDNQWLQLTDADRTDHALGGILAYFPEKGKLIWYPAEQLSKLKQEGHRSINPDKLPSVGYSVPFNKKRVRIYIPASSFLKVLEKHKEELKWPNRNSQKLT